MAGILLAIDIGNTTTTAGLFRGSRLVLSTRLPSRLDLAVDECVEMLSSFFQKRASAIPSPEQAVISSVVPRLTPVYTSAIGTKFGVTPILVSATLPVGLKIGYRRVEQLGADRLANAVAGFHLYGGPVVVVDLGTATKFEVVTKKGEYLGGAIGPGVETASVDLVRRTALLPKVVLKRPKRAIGRSTEEALQAGILIGAAGGIDRMVAEIETELGAKVKVIATGGLAKTVAGLSKRIRRVDPDLTLKGLRIIAERVDLTP
ncbi:MAG: type III pantothenate kinase [candidate division Zixibacteria bacterium]|nr:type III pantothenate kinase [candidate division Zixibacteria bacterium]